MHDHSGSPTQSYPLLNRRGRPLDDNSHFHRLALAPAGICCHLVLDTSVPKFKHQVYHISDFRLFGVALFSDRAIL